MDKMDPEPNFIRKSNEINPNDSLQIRPKELQNKPTMVKNHNQKESNQLDKEMLASIFNSEIENNTLDQYK